MPFSNSETVWRKLHAPVKRGAVTLLPGGNFSTVNGPTFNIEVTIEGLSMGGARIDTCRNELRTCGGDGSVHLFKYENESWFEAQQPKGSTKTQTPPSSGQAGSDRPNPSADADWHKLKAPVKRGPVTLLPEGSFSLLNGPRFNVGAALQGVAMGGAVIDTNGNQLRVGCADGSVLLFKFENDSWFESKIPKGEAKPAQGPMPSSIREDLAGWPDLPMYDDTDLKPAACSNQFNSHSHKGLMPIPKPLKMVHYVSMIVDRLKEAKLPGTIGWSQTFGYGNDRCGIQILRSYIGDTYIRSMIVCSAVGEVLTVELVTNVVLWRSIPLKQRIERFFSRLLPLVLWLLAGLVAWQLSEGSMTKADSWQTITLRFVCCAFALHRVTLWNIQLDYPWVNWSPQQRRDLRKEYACTPRRLFLFGCLISLLVSLPQFQRTNFRMDLPISQLVYADFRFLSVGILVLPVAFYLLWHALKRALFPIDCPPGAPPLEGEHKGTHQAVFSAMAQKDLFPSL